MVNTSQVNDSGFWRQARKFGLRTGQQPKSGLLRTIGVQRQRLKADSAARKAALIHQSLNKEAPVGLENFAPELNTSVSLAEIRESKLTTSLQNFSYSWCYHMRVVKQQFEQLPKVSEGRLKELAAKMREAAIAMRSSREFTYQGACAKFQDHAAKVINQHMQEGKDNLIAISGRFDSPLCRLGTYIESAVSCLDSLLEFKKTVAQSSGQLARPYLDSAIEEAKLLTKAFFAKLEDESKLKLTQILEAGKIATGSGEGQLLNIRELLAGDMRDKTLDELGLLVEDEA